MVLDHRGVLSGSNPIQHARFLVGVNWLTTMPDLPTRPPILPNRYNRHEPTSQWAELSGRPGDLLEFA